MNALKDASHHQETERDQASTSPSPSFTPWERDRPIPWVMFALAFALAIWGAFMLWSESSPDADHPPMVMTSEPPATASVFRSHCATCHQANGVGVQGAVPPLVHSPYLLAAAPAVPVQILLHGLHEHISVRDYVYNGRMPSFREVLNDAQIAATLTELRNAWGHQTEPIEASFVAIQRARFPERGPWRGELELRQVFGKNLDQDTTGMDAHAQTVNIAESVP